MSRRRLLNITSTKKQDNMLHFYHTDPNNPGTPVQGAGTVIGSVGGTFLWNATFRDRSQVIPALGQADRVAMTMRESDTCFIRGVKERLRLTTNTGQPWAWRRIVFTNKGFYDALIAVGVTPNQLNTVRLEQNNSGWSRVTTNIRNTTIENLTNNFLFKGQINIDWSDVHTAAVDTSRVTLLYDKRRVLRSGNASGILKEVKQWLPVNKNIVYDNDENGNTESNSGFSVTGKAGMGDLWIMDFFDCIEPSSTNELRFGTHATLYWHEK